MIESSGMVARETDLHDLNRDGHDTRLEHEVGAAEPARFTAALNTTTLESNEPLHDRAVNNYPQGEGADQIGRLSQDAEESEKQVYKRILDHPEI